MSEVSPKDPQDAQPKPVTATTTAVTGLLRTGQRAVQAMNKSLTNFSQNRANTAQDEPRVQPLHEQVIGLQHAIGGDKSHSYT